jgi:hypothetical protein
MDITTVMEIVNFAPISGSGWHASGDRCSLGSSGQLGLDCHGSRAALMMSSHRPPVV